jgi:glyoxylase-like metal-dependent hydrolase (beta-lactamase superfamily II)
VIHHLNCGTLRPVGTVGGRLAPRRLVAHCLLVERAEGLLLVDTGFGCDDVRNPGRLGRPFVMVMRPALDLAETAAEQLRRLGHHPADVTDIALTHLDLDHAGGLADFAAARVHVHAAELEAATHPHLSERARYVRSQWAHGPRWVSHETAGDPWFGLEAVRALGDDVLLVPLHGHTRGHCGVAVRRPGGGWLLHAGDAYFSVGEIRTPPTAPAGIRAYQRLMAADDHLRRVNQARLRELQAGHGDEIEVFSAHDPDELGALAAG